MDTKYKNWCGVRVKRRKADCHDAMPCGMLNRLDNRLTFFSGFFLSLQYPTDQEKIKRKRARGKEGRDEKIGKIEGEHREPLPLQK